MGLKLAYRFLLVIIFVSSVSATLDLAILSDLKVNNSYTDVQSIYVDGYFLTLYVGDQVTPPPESSYDYHIGLYQLVNSQLSNIAIKRRFFRIQSQNDHLYMTAGVDNSAFGMFSASFNLCSSRECSRVSVNEQDFSLTGTENWCHSDISMTDELHAAFNDLDLDYTLAVIFQGTDLKAFICPSNLPLQTETVKLECFDNSGPFDNIHSAEIIMQASYVSIFVLQSNAHSTALCTFTQPINVVSGSTLQASSKLLFETSPVALAVTPVGADYIAFVCSASGQISKVYIQGDAAYKISQFAINPPITGAFSKMALGDDKLLLNTKERVILLDVKHTCAQHTDLCSCRAPKDPKCGWCVNSNKCSESNECVGIWMKADPSSNRICWNATFSPQSVARSNPEPLSITINDDMGADQFGLANAYRCIFGSTNITTAASSVSAQSLRCAQPSASSLALLPAGTLTLPVVVYHNVREDYLPLIVQYKVVICSDITRCDECVNSHNTCTWCINNHRCTKTTEIEQNCPHSLDDEAKSPFGSNGTCPTINMDTIRAPVNEMYPLLLSVKNFPTLSNQNYSCQVTQGDQSKILQATLNDQQSTVECSPYQYGVGFNSTSFLLNSFQVSVLVGDESWILASAQGKVYDCSYQVACTNCIQFAASTSCVWCQGSLSNRCVYSQCTQTENPILDQCPSLDILSQHVLPRFVPIEGGETLNINGKGLSVGGQDNTEVLVNGQMCTGITVTRLSLRNDSITCTIPKVQSRINATLKVVINGISWQRDTFITFYDPVLTGVNVVGTRDRHGPQAGGTDIRLSGVDLNYLNTTSWGMEFFLLEYPEEVYNLPQCTIEGAWIRCKTPPVDLVAKYMVRLRFTSEMITRVLDAKKGVFDYRPDSAINKVTPNYVIAWGGKQFTVSGTFLNSVSNPQAKFSGSNEVVSCIVVSAIKITCTYPEFEFPGLYEVILIMDGIDINNTTLPITVTTNPDIKGFTQGGKLILDGTNIDNVGTDEIQVFVGGEPCEIIKKESSTVICEIPDLDEKQQKENTDVTVSIYNVTRFALGSLNYDAVSPQASAKLGSNVIGGIVGGGSAAVIIMVIVAVLLFKRSRYHKQRYKTMVKHVDQLECNSRHEIKQAFAELQTDMSDLMSDLNVTGIPYWDYKNFTFKILFPGQTDHPSLHKLMTKRKTAVMQALDMFEHLINNKDFLVSFIHTLENQPTFTMPDKVQLAALLMVSLQHKMDYATCVIKELLTELIDASIKKKHPKLLLRRSESVVEKMLTHWLSLCLYKYLQDHAGTPLFMLFKAIKHQIDKGPVDALSGEARYSLSQERLLRLTVDTKPVTLDVILENGEKIQCKVNDCDTTTQVKEKILDVIYKNQAYSQRPTALDYNLEWHHGMVGVPICDEDLTSQTINGWKRLNTLSHYSIADNATMKLVSRHHAHSLHSDRSLDTDKLCDTMSSNKGTPKGTLNRSTAYSINNLQDHYVHSHISLWHLSKSGASQTLPKDRQQTMMSEIFLTRLLKTKGTLQEFIDKLFQTIFSADNLPPTIKYLFDFLDQEAVKHGITDPEVVHVWKNNSLNLRFWVNIIKNPEFVFDIHKSEIVDASLSTIAQTFIDSCAMSESDFGADAPINKLLFARDRPKYRKMLQNMYSEIKNQPQLPESILNAHLSELSKMYPREFYRNSALKEIYQFAQRYQSQIAQDLEDNFSKHRNPNLTTLLRDINATLDERHNPMNEYV